MVITLKKMIIINDDNVMVITLTKIMVVVVTIRVDGDMTLPFPQMRQTFFPSEEESKDSFH